MEQFNQNIFKYQDLLADSLDKKMTKKRIVELRKAILVLCKGAVAARKELSAQSKAMTKKKKPTRAKVVSGQPTPARVLSASV